MKKNIPAKILLLMNAVLFTIILMELIFIGMEKITGKEFLYDKLITKKYYPYTNFFDEEIGWIKDDFKDINKKYDSETILILGDSISYGLCTNENFGKKISDFLVKDEKNFSVVNTAMGGYNTLQEYLVFRRINFSPDIIILQVYANDIIPSLITINRSYGIDTFGSFDYENKRKKLIVSLVEKSRFFRLAYWQILNYNIRKFRDNRTRYVEEQIPIVEKYFYKILDENRKYDAEIIIVFFPSMDTRYVGVNKELIGFLSDFTRKNNLFFVDLTEEYEKYDLKSDRLDCPEYDFNHPNEFGHELAAEKIYQILTANNLV
ncbi:SGNH/GDSL hydrolase family protein [Bacteroidota bacterium]